MHQNVILFTENQDEMDWRLKHIEPVEQCGEHIEQVENVERIENVEQIENVERINNVERVERR